MSKGIIYTPRIRKSPFFEETIKDGASNFTTYNPVSYTHLTLPTKDSV